MRWRRRGPDVLHSCTLHCRVVRLVVLHGEKEIRSRLRRAARRRSRLAMLEILQYCTVLQYS